LPDSDECIYWETYDCMDMVPETMSDEVYSCTYDSAYDYCNEYEVECWATVNINGVYQELTCDEMMDEFNIYPSDDSGKDYSDKSDDDCYGYWEEEGSCLDMLADFNVEGLESCQYWYTAYDCEGWEECYAEVYVNGEFHEGTCDEIEEHFGMDHDYSSGDDEETCTQWGEPLDCYYDFYMEVEGLWECEYRETYDCNDEYKCKARAQIYDDWYELPCDEMEELFGLDDSDFSGDDECYTE